MISASTRFLAQPREIRPTRSVGLESFAIMNLNQSGTEETTGGGHRLKALCEPASAWGGSFVLGLSFPGPFLSFRRSGIDLGVISLFPEQLIDCLLQCLRRRHRIFLVGFDKDQLPTRAAHAEENGDAAGVRFAEGARGFESLGREMDGIQTKENLAGELTGRILQGHEL